MENFNFEEDSYSLQDWFRKTENTDEYYQENSGM
jgi:hypothetical protein